MELAVPPAACVLDFSHPPSLKPYFHLSHCCALPMHIHVGSNFAYLENTYFVPTSAPTLQVFFRLKIKSCPNSFFFKKKKRFLFIYFLERGEGREKERERNISVELPLVCPLLRTWPTTQACALTGNRTSNLLVCRMTPSPLSRTSQSKYIHILCETHCHHLVLELSSCKAETLDP